VSEHSRFRGERGQASPEWVGLILLVALLLGSALAGVGALPLGVSLARTVGGKLICAIDLSDACQRDPELTASYGADLAEAVRDHAPMIFYEHGMRALPVDFRSCRSAPCGDAAGEGRVWRTDRGGPATAFVHVIDCRAGEPAAFAGANRPADCSGSRAGNLYIQYWLYYAESATLRGVPVVGAKGYHLDDWESYQVRVGPGGDSDARASSHNGYNYQQGAQDWGSDAGLGIVRSATEAVGLRNHNGWGPDIGFLFVSGGSHAGSVEAFLPNYSRLTPPRHLALVPLEPVAAGEQRAPHFAIPPPWLKQVWRDPEAEGTG
jgi:hypothetical protein